MYKPKVTIITAVYNRVDKIEQCISSVVSQTYDNFEYIIIDGGSTDGTVDVIKKYDEQIAYWYSGPDSGIYDAWNKGLSRATGEYINFIGSDDAMLGTRVLENVVEKIKPEDDFICGNVMVVKEKIGREFIWTVDFIKNKENYKGGCLPIQGAFIRKSLLDKYKFDITYRIAGDYKFFLQCYYNPSVKFAFIDEFIQYFSDDGISFKDISYLRIEDNRIYTELCLNELTDSHLKFRGCSIKYHLKTCFKSVGIWELVQERYHVYIKGDWKKHHCNNKICRWCGRYES